MPGRVIVAAVLWLGAGCDGSEGLTHTGVSDGGAAVVVVIHYDCGDLGAPAVDRSLLDAETHDIGEECRQLREEGWGVTTCCRRAQATFCRDDRM